MSLIAACPAKAEIHYPIWHMGMVIIRSLMVLVSLYPLFQSLLLCTLPLCQLIIQCQHFPLKQKLTRKASWVCLLESCPSFFLVESLWLLVLHMQLPLMSVTVFYVMLCAILSKPLIQSQCSSQILLALGFVPKPLGAGFNSSYKITLICSFMNMQGFFNCTLKILSWFKSLCNTLGFNNCKSYMYILHIFS